MDPAAAPSKPTAPARFLDAAARLFARDGFHGVSMRDIARELGVTPGAVYAHFPSKAQVLAAVYAEGVCRVAARVDAATAGAGDPWQRLERAAAAHLEAVLDRDSGYAAVVVRVLPADAPALRDQLTALRDGYEQRFRALVGALPLAPGADPKMLRMTLLGALNWAQVWHHGGEADPASIARSVVAMLRRGVETRQEERP